MWQLFDCSKYKIYINNRVNKISFLVIIVLLFTVIDSFSIPQIYEITHTNIYEGQSGVIIKGKNFGYNKLKNVEFIKDDIETGAVGTAFEKGSWKNYYNNKVEYTSLDKHSGSKSLLFDFSNTSTRGIIYDFGEDINEAYFSAWVKLEKKDDVNTFQWKNWRIKNTNDYNAQTAIVGDNWYYKDRGWANVSVINVRNTLWDQESKRTVEKDAFIFDEWQRLEAYYKKSDVGDSNGMFEWRRVGRSGSEIIVFNDRVMTHDATNIDQLWHYLFIGHYYGNLKNADGSAYTGAANMKVFYDDIYVSQTRARVEIGNNKIFSMCTHREVQGIQKWPPVINDAAIMIKINKGSFGNGPAYLFVIDANGAPSEGHPITFK